jgi:pyrrolidone-carboxylate peptidase
VAARQLPCVFGDALTALNAALDELDPVLTLAIGQAGSRVDITVERVAINVDDARIPTIKACSRSTYRSLPAGRRRTSARCRSKRS